MTHTAQHTPGPWTVADDAAYNDDQDAWTCTIRDSNGLRRAEVIGTDEENESWLAADEANATLIAAAPELLACLDEVKAYFKTMSDAGLIAKPIILETKLDNAIAKAKGVTQ